MSINVVNLDELQNYLGQFHENDFSEEDRAIRTWLFKNVRRHILKHELDFRPFESCDMPPSPPEWLQQAVDDTNSRSLLRIFVPKENLTKEIQQIVDFFRSEVIESRILKPHQLKNISYPQAVEKAEKYALQLKKKSSIPEGEKIVMEFENGLTVREIKKEEGLDREGHLMGHCTKGVEFMNRYVDIYGYKKDLKNGTRCYFSIRDKNNTPHVTIEVATKERMVVQCEGKDGGSPAKKYLPLIQQFVKKFGLDPLLCLDSVRLFKSNRQYYDLHKIPEGASCHGDLTLSGLTGDDITLPKNFTVNGNMIMTDCRNIPLPENLTINGDLLAMKTNISVWPKKMYVKGSANFRGIKSLDLPDYLDAEIVYLSVSDLRAGLTVRGSLDLKGCPDSELPAGLIVRKKLFLKGSGITTIPKDFYKNNPKCEVIYPRSFNAPVKHLPLKTHGLELRRRPMAEKI